MDSVYVWMKKIDMGQEVHRCEVKGAAVEIWPRPSYCDRGRWQAYILDDGYPDNPNPFDISDGFPRYYFDLDRAKAEMEEMFRVRKMPAIRIA